MVVLLGSFVFCRKCVAPVSNSYKEKGINSMPTQGKCTSAMPQAARASNAVREIAGAEHITLEQFACSQTQETTWSRCRLS